MEKAVRCYYPIAQSMAKGDDDLQQELMLWVIDHLVYKQDVNEQYILQRMNLQVKAYNRGYRIVDGAGTSVDRGDPTGRKQHYALVPYDCMDGYCPDILNGDLEMMYARHPSPEREALFHVDYEKFIASLTDLEKRYLDAKLKGMSWTEIDRQRIVDRNQQHRVKESIKEKMRAYF